MSLRDAILGMERAAAEERFYLAAHRLRSYLIETRYRPDQPRVPAGNPEGGQWTNDGGGHLQVTAITWRLLDQRVGPGPNGLIRSCTYIDSTGIMRTIFIDAIRLCPPTFPFPQAPNAS
jgi:hypothetical protein